MLTARSWSRRLRLSASAIHGDVRQARRFVRSHPIVAAVAILSLALGIAGATTIVAVADALFFRPADGVRDAGRLVDIARSTNGSGYGPMAYPAFRHLREHTQTLQAMAATTMDPMPLNLTDDDGSRRVFGRTVSADFFDVLRTRPALGRFFRAHEDNLPGLRPVVVLSHDFWREHFGSHPDAVGRQIRLNRVPFTIVGVAEPGFVGVKILGADLWVPMAMAGVVRGDEQAQVLRDPAETWHVAIGRLRDGVTPQTAEAELNGLLDAYKTSTPAMPREHGVAVVETGRLPIPVRARFGSFLGLLFALATGLLAIACSNVVGMLLIRATSRQREVATRLALGSSRAALLRMMVAETLLLFVAAAIVAVPLSYGLLGAFSALLPAFPLPVQLDLVVSGRTLVFAGATALLAGIVFGVIPARHALRADLAPLMRGRTSTDHGSRLRLRHALLGGQVAVSLVLVTTAGLFGRALQAAADVDPGFQPRNVAVASIDPAVARWSAAQTPARLDVIVERVRLLPGVSSAGYSRMIPLFSGSLALGGIRMPGWSDTENAVFHDANWDAVSPGYFETLGVRIVSGRALAADDRDGRPLVAVVNETFARRAWRGGPALGRQFHASMFCEWKGPAPVPPPMGRRTTTGTRAPQR
jgi:predicted permease